jgi:hypothetical protein
MVAKVQIRFGELSLLHELSVQKLYREAWKECSMDGDEPPRPGCDSESRTGLEVVVEVEE